MPILEYCPNCDMFEMDDTDDRDCALVQDLYVKCDHCDGPIAIKCVPADGENEK